MKKYISICAIAFCALIIASCNNETNNDIPEVAPSGEKTPIVKTITLSLGSDDSRTTYTPEGNKLKVTWKEGDKIGIYSTREDDNDPDEFTLVSGAGTADGIFTGEFTKAIDASEWGEEGLDSTYYVIVYPYIPGKTPTEISNAMKEKLTQCQYGDIAHLEEYDPLYCLCDELEAETNPYDRTLKHSIAVVKVTTPTPTNTETMVGIRGAWQPGFTYYAKNNGSNTTYIAVPKSTYISYSDKGTDGGGFRDFYVAMYDETNHKCTSYKKSRAHGAGGKIEESKIASVTVSNADEILTYDWDGFKGNYEYVNMGNNIGMATMNIGANSPEDYGYYFRFGEQEGWKIEGYYTDANNNKAIFVNDTTFKVPLNATNCRQYRNDGIVRTYFSNMEFYSNSYYGIWGLNSCSIPDTNGDGSYFQGLINKSVNNTTYGDASTYNWGAGWMTMSSDIITSNNWTTIEETTSPRAGYWLSSNNKTVFWPAACHCLAHQRQGEDPLKSHKYCGHYWSVLPKGTEKAYYYNFVIGRVKIEWTDGTSSSSSTTSDTDGGGRHGGFSIRPICDLSK